MKLRKIIWFQTAIVTAVLLIFEFGCKKDSTNENPVIPKIDTIFLSEGDSPSWSPDGNKIAFIANNVLYTMNADGSGKKALATDILSRPAWSHSGNYLLYIGQNHNIYQQKADGSEASNLTFSTNYCAVPSWSPDDQQIAFYMVEGTAFGNLYLMKNDGKNIRKLTNINTVSPFQSPNWTPDGSSIMFSAVNDSEADIFFVNSDGSNLRQLEIDTILETDAQLSPDGTKIYFGGSTSTSWRIYQVKSDGTGIINLSSNLGMKPVFRLSPDGTRIAFTDGHVSEDGWKDGLYLMAQDGSDQKLFLSKGFWDFEWSPDSQKICYVELKGGISNIYTVTVPK